MSRHVGALLISLAIVAVIGLNMFWFRSIPRPTVTTSVASSLPTPTRSLVTSIDWKNVAQIAWRYYQPDVGVNRQTGISRAKLDWDALTDWNTGSYILATIDAHRLGLVETNGTWGFKDRMSRVIRHLLTRQLTTNLGVGSWPYWAYYWDGRPYHNPVYLYTDVSDSGRLLYALDILRKYDLSFVGQVQQAFQRCKIAYDAMARRIDERLNYYGVLEAVGFKAFGYDKSHVISVFENWRGNLVVVEDQILPLTQTATEPTLHGILDLGLGGQFMEYARRVYEAQKTRTVRTGRLSGWSEGCHPVHEYVYEWILTDQGEAWVIAKHDGTKLSIDPLMYTKIAFGYYAIFGANSYTLALLNAVSGLYHDRFGFGEATFENGQSALSLWGNNKEGFYSDSTNQIILAAARYVLKR